MALDQSTADGEGRGGDNTQVGGGKKGGGKIDEEMLIRSNQDGKEYKSF